MVVAAPPGGLAERLVQRAREYAANAREPATRRAYQGDWRRFTEWCSAQGVEPLPPDPVRVAAYAAWMADGGTRGKPYGVATIRRALASIAVVSLAAGYDYPYADRGICATMEGIARKLGVKQRKMAPLEVEALSECFARHRDDLLGLRDKSMVALGFFFAARRASLADVEVEHISFVPEGLHLTLPKTKTDPTGAQADVPIGIPYARNPAVCAVRLLKQWLAASGITTGPVFRRVFKSGAKIGERRLDPGSIARIIKGMVEEVGLDPTLYAGHSLRSGFITSCARRRVPLDAIMRQSRHKSEKIVMGYIRVANVLDETNAARAIT